MLECDRTGIEPPEWKLEEATGRGRHANALMSGLMGSKSVVAPNIKHCCEGEMRYKQEKTGQKNVEKKSRQENKNGQWRIMTTDQPLVRGGEVGIAPKVVITEQLPHHDS